MTSTTHTTLTNVNERSIRIILGIKLRQYRLARQLSLTQLAQVSGVSVSYLTEIEKAKKYPKPEKLSAIATALQVSYGDLTSLDLDRKLAPLVGLLNSNILDELPLDLFGLDTGKLMEFFLTAPDKIGAFLQTIIQLMRLYEMDVEQFFFSALRAYQELKNNYFEELETSAEAFWEQFGPPTDTQLTRYLTHTLGITLNHERLLDYPDLEGLRSFWSADQRTLYLNPKLNQQQYRFVLAREAGFHLLKLDPRPDTFSYVKPSSFEIILNNYKASYFAGALLMQPKAIVQDFQRLLSEPVWQEARLRGLLYKYEASPEMLLHRLTSLAPRFLGLSNLFFLRFSDKGRIDKYQITKELHLSGLHSPHANLRYEHYCRRWISLEVLKSVAQNPDKAPVIGIQQSKYLDSGKAYLVLAAARPMFPTQGENCSVSIGFELNEETYQKIKFLDQIPEIIVNETCERCTLSSCRVRQFDPVVWERKEQNRRKSKAIKALKKATS
ncbi:MAG: helix-turn-helix domain-containing protein [Bernardetiaceae bacterium]